MQYIHLTCSWSLLHDLVDDLNEQFASRDDVRVLDYGVSPKQIRAYIVLGWDAEVEQSFVDDLLADSAIDDLCIFTLPCSVASYCSPLFV